MKLERFTRGGGTTSMRPRLGATTAALASLLLAVVGLVLMSTPAQAVTPTISCDSDANQFNTGYDGNGGKAEEGTSDRAWRVSRPFDGTVPADQTTRPSALVNPDWQPANVNKVWDLDWIDSPYGNAQWISREQKNVLQANANQDYYYRYDFNLDPSVDRAAFALNMDFYADNTVAEVYVNDEPQSQYSPSDNLPSGNGDPYGFYGFQSGAEAHTTLTHDWRPGLNTLVVHVKTSYPVEGLLAQWQPSPICPTVKVTKQVVSRAVPGDSFQVTLGELNANGQVGPTQTASTGPSATTVTTDWLSATTGSRFRIDETSTGADISNYGSSISCVGARTGTTVEVTDGIFAPPALDNWECTLSNTAKEAKLSLVKRASKVTDVNGNGITDAGDTLAYEFDVKNQGQVPLHNISVRDPKLGTVDCPAGPLAVGASVTCTSSAVHVVNAADVAAGSFQNAATAEGYRPGDNTTPVTATGETTVPTTAPAPALTLKKIVIDPPATSKVLTTKDGIKIEDANGNGVIDAKDKIYYAFDVKNTGNVLIDDLSIDDSLLSAAGIQVTCDKTALAPTESATCKAAGGHEITQAEVDAGSVTNTASANGTPHGGSFVPPTSSTTTGLPNGTAALTLEKKLLDPPADSKVVKDTKIEDVNENDRVDAGDKLYFGFTVTNHGTVTISPVQVSDPLLAAQQPAISVTCPGGPLAPGASIECKADAGYALTQADLDSGKVHNVATATGKNPKGDDVPPADDELDTPLTPAPGLTVDKKVAKVTDVNHNGRTDQGDTITWDFLATNTGNVTIADLAVEDKLLQDADITVTCPVTTLAPGASTTCTTDDAYVITAADAIDGKVDNVATVVGSTPKGEDTESPEDKTTTTVTHVEPKASPGHQGRPGPFGPAGTSWLPNTGGPALALGGLGVLLVAGGALVLLVGSRKRTIKG